MYWEKVVPVVLFLHCSGGKEIKYCEANMQIGCIDNVEDETKVGTFIALFTNKSLCRGVSLLL